MLGLTFFEEVLYFEDEALLSKFDCFVFEGTSCRFETVYENLLGLTL